MATFQLRIITAGLLLNALVLPLPQALAASPCKGVDTTLTEQRKSDYAALIADALDQDIMPSKVSVMDFMQSGTWAVVYAEVPVADPGYFFFDFSSGKAEFKDVWGGIAEKSEAAEIAKWARDLGTNKTIASCFADTVAVAE